MQSWKSMLKKEEPQSQWLKAGEEKGDNSLFHDYKVCLLVTANANLQQGESKSKGYHMWFWLNRH